MSKAVYYLLPLVHLESFRAHAGAYLLGVPQPTAVTGLAYALGLAVARAMGRPLVQAPAVAYGVQNWAGFAGLSLNQRQASDAPSAKLTTPGAIDDRVRSSVTLTLLLEFVFEGDTAPTAAEVASLLESMRLQSGSMFVRGKPAQFVSLNEAAKYIPRDAFFLVDGSTEMAEALEKNPDTRKALLSFIERPSDRDEYKPRWVPALVGWRPFYEPSPRSEMRAGAKAHAMAEPVIGLARFRSAASVKSELRTKDPELSSILWKHTESRSPHLHYVAKGIVPFADGVDFS